MKENSLKYKRLRWNFAKSSRCDISRQCATVKLVRTWMSNHFSESRDQIPQERLARQVLLATPKGKWPRCRPRTRWSDYDLRPRFVPWCGAGPQPETGKPGNCPPEIFANMMASTSPTSHKLFLYVNFFSRQFFRIRMRCVIRV